MRNKPGTLYRNQVGQKYQRNFFLRVATAFDPTPAASKVTFFRYTVIGGRLDPTFPPVGKWIAQITTRQGQPIARRRELVGMPMSDDVQKSMADTHVDI